MSTEWTKNESKGCFQVLLIMAGMIFGGMIFYAILDGIDNLFNLIPWFIWPIIIILGIYFISGSSN